MLNIQIVKTVNGFTLISEVTLIDEIQENERDYATYGEALRALNRLTNSLILDADAGYFDSEGQ